MCSLQLAILNGCSNLKNQFDWCRSSGSGNFTRFRQSLPFSSSIKKTTKLIGVSVHRAQQPIDWSSNIIVVPEAGTNVFGINNVFTTSPNQQPCEPFFNEKNPKTLFSSTYFYFPPYLCVQCMLAIRCSFYRLISQHKGIETTKQ